jgi:thiosulfate/3-mercaptopyruvate sulfurtransferase
MSYHVHENKGLREGRPAAYESAVWGFTLKNQGFSDGAVFVGGLHGVFCYRHRRATSRCITPSRPNMIGADPGDFTMKHIAMKGLHLFAVACILLSQSGPALAQHIPAASIPAADLIQPADLAANLKSASALKPLILQVGFRTLYAQAHIADSEYVGAAGEDVGLQLLRNRVAKLAKDTAIVIYCGCCPWSHCPNIAAGYYALHALGFTQVKVLYIADNFGDNWVKLGYPVGTGR